MTKLDNKKRGISIIKILIIGAIAILVLSYFNISVKSVVESPTGQENINYVKGGTTTIWAKYFAGPVSYFWNEIWIKIFWRSFINNMERIRDGKPTDFDTNAPTVDGSVRVP